MSPNATRSLVISTRAEEKKLKNEVKEEFSPSPKLMQPYMTFDTTKSFSQDGGALNESVNPSLRDQVQKTLKTIYM